MMISEFMRPEMIEARRVELIAAADRYRLAQVARAERQSLPERAMWSPLAGARQALATLSLTLGGLLLSPATEAVNCVGDPAACCC
jgi:hypothetical protein